MVQVDAFWSYGIGAGFALAGARRLRASSERLVDGALFRDLLLVLAVVFVPSGIYLLWAFPSWETMHAGDRGLPAWLVAAFAATNVTQGLLGYSLSARAVRRGDDHAAFLHFVGAYFGMFFVLVHGWDGTGFQRFTAVDRAAFETWSPATAGAWLRSEVARTLIVMGVVVIPAIVVPMGRLLREGDPRRRSTTTFALAVLATTVVLVPALATGASFTIRMLGWPIGTVAFVAVVALVFVRRGGLLDRLNQWLLAGDGSPCPDPSRRSPAALERHL
jgi:hypothetical protein